MRHALTALAVLCGLTAGWMLPPLRQRASSPSQPTAAAVAKIPERVRHARTRQLLAVLLDERELAVFKRKSAKSLAALLGSIGQSGQFWQEDVRRIVAMDPAAAVEHLLSAPGASEELGGTIVWEWATRDPNAAIGFLLKKTSYRAERFLCQALIGACGSNPQLVADAIRSKPRRWQLRNLKFLFSSGVAIPTGAEPAAPSEDPFADNPAFRSGWFGENILDCLADDELREKARACWKDDPFATLTPKSEPETPPDLTTISGDDLGERWKLQALLRAHPEETIAAVVEKGNLQARSIAMTQAVWDFPFDKESWPEGFKRLEELMAKLEVIPENLPSHFEMGPFLEGSEAADWIGHQPLALQREWSPTFTETWARNDPELAINWARELPPGAAGDEAAQRGLIVWAHSKPLEAAVYVADLPPGDLREAALSNTAAAWACVDRPGAAAWLAKLPDSPGKARAIARVK